MVTNKEAYEFAATATSTDDLEAISVVTRRIGQTVLALLHGNETLDVDLRLSLRFTPRGDAYRLMAYMEVERRDDYIGPGQQV
jgi:hypothetical protein